MYKTAALAAILAMTSMTAAAQSPQTPGSSVIVTQGESILKIAPDQAWVTITVESREGKAANARREAATQMGLVQTAIKATGLPADGIRTTGFLLQPQMEWDGSRMRTKEYAVRNEIEVRIDALDLLGDVLDAAASVKTSGSLSVSVTEMRFDLKNRAASEQETLRRAVQDAMARAQSMVGGAGRTLGAIIRIEEQREADKERQILMPSVRNPMGLANGPAGRGASVGPQNQASPVNTPILPNQIEVRTRVSITVAIS